MWKKLFYDASRRFANDVSNIVGNEMKKKAKQKSNSPNLINSDKQRATHLNRLKKILLMQKEDIDTLTEIANSFKDMISSDIEFKEIDKNLEKIQRITDSHIKMGIELPSTMGIGEYLGNTTGDYTVKFKSKDVLKFNHSMTELIANVKNMGVCLKEDQSHRELSINFFMDNYRKLSLPLKNEIDEKYKELTNMNKETIWSNGRTQIIDYND